MANPTYLVRNSGGSYQLQVRLKPALAKLMGRSHFKTTLRTHDPGVAKERSYRVMSRIEPYIRASDLTNLGGKVWNDMRLELRLGPTVDGSRYHDRQLIGQIAREFQEQARNHDLGDRIDMFAFGKDFLEFCRLQEAELAAFRATERGQILLCSDSEPLRAIAASPASTSTPSLAEITSDLAEFGAALKQSSPLSHRVLCLKMPMNYANARPLRSRWLMPLVNSLSSSASRGKQGAARTRQQRSWGSWMPISISRCLPT